MLLEIKSVSKNYYHSDGSTTKAVDNFSLAINEGEFVALVGPSGCGKTTLLRLIAGLETPTSGELLFRGNAIKTTDRARGVVFQDFTLFSWLTVANNIGYGPNLRNIDRKKRDSVINEYLEVIGLKDAANRFPLGLSGGMQQRVAIARTLANDPEIILMDEPFGALDVQTRSKMQEFLATLWEGNHKTVVFVTHDLEEALFLADRVFLLSGSPARIMEEIVVPFHRPRRTSIKLTDDFFELKKKVSQLMMA